jgi:asparagine synthase (glutamine-hydrolysing)
MCGIVGILNLDGSPVDRSRLERMLASIAHRGPDASGTHLEPGVGLGHARLSIIDLSGGQQPMANEDGSLWVTFNGEIFNYVELAQELAAAGHRFATRSDTEVILHAFEDHGPDCVQRFNGQWAWAVWDRRRRRLVASRDRLGVRPLYYTRLGNTLLFASEVKALLAHGDVPLRLDPQGLDQVFTYWSPIAPRTVFAGIYELPPGHHLVVDADGLRTERYWQLTYGDAPARADAGECAEQLLELLADATRLRLRSDVPVGAYLSGGLDSSVTAALVRRAVGPRLRTFSITFDDAEFDESVYQREVVDYLETEHASIHCQTADIGRVFPQVIWHAERPVVRTAPAPMYLLASLVHELGYKVVVTGEGADEMLGGYDLFKEAKVRRFWASAPDSALRARLLERLYPYLPGLRAQPPAYRQAFFRARPEDLAHPLFAHLPRWELTARLKTFLTPAFQASPVDDPYADARALLPPGYEAWDPLEQAQYVEAVTLLPGYILSAQGDRMAMAHGVEGRYPLLDHRLAEFAARLPARLKMKGIQEKYLLKQAAAGLVPESVRRRSKQPYRAPDASCFFVDGRARFDYVAELLSPERVAADGVFRPQAVAQLVRKARLANGLGVKDSMALVSILSTQLLVEQYVRGMGQPCAERAAGTVCASVLSSPVASGPPAPTEHIQR